MWELWLKICLLFVFKEKFRTEFGIAMRCCSESSRRRRRRAKATHNFSPTHSVVTSLTRAPKQYPPGSSPRRRTSPSGGSPILNHTGNAVETTETILLCTMASTYSNVADWWPELQHKRTTKGTAPMIGQTGVYYPDFSMCYWVRVLLHTELFNGNLFLDGQGFKSPKFCRIM